VRFFIYLLSIFLAFNLTFAKNEIIKINSEQLFNFQKGSQQLFNSNKHSVLLATNKIKPININKKAISDLINQATDKLQISNFVLDDFNKFDIILSKEDNSTLRNTKVIIHNKNGDKVYTMSNYAFYSGKLSGQEDSRVFLSLMKDNLYMYIQKEDGETFSISPIKDNIDEMHLLTPHTLDYDDEHSLTYSCETGDHSGKHNEMEDLLKHSDKLQSTTYPLLEARIICEGAFDYYELLGSNEDKVISHIGSVMLLSSKIYQENLNITFFVPEIHIRTDYYDDPYNATENLAQKLQYMPNVWINHKTPRALVVLFANLRNQPANTVVAGISMGGSPYTGSVCNTSRGYCVLGITNQGKFPTINYTWDVNVATHEMGHNFSAPHTHNCYWSPRMIDTCVTKTKPFPIGDACLTGNNYPVPGTIMSYCHTSNSTRNVQLIFHPRQHPLMRGAATNSKCVLPKSEKFISLLAPLGGLEYKANKQLSVRWTHSQLDNVNIFLSTDNGVNWTKQNNEPLTANDTVYKIVLPDVRTTTALVRIEDAFEPTIYDESLLNFTINVQDIKYLYPRTTESYMMGEPIKAQWTQAMTEDFNLEFTKDNGATWQQITPTAKYLYSSQPVDFESEFCQFRLTSKEDGTQHYSQIFSIGKPQLELTSPNGGERAAAKYWYFVKWNSKNLNKLQLEYSVDNGANWKRVAVGFFDAIKGEYTWTVPNQITDSARIRVKTTVEPYEILDESDSVFSIYEAPVSVEEVPQVSQDFEILSISPNPADEKQMIILRNNSITAIKFDVSIVDTDGKNHFEIKDLSVNPLTEFAKEINTKKLAMGNYFLIINYNGSKISKKVIISR